MEPDKGLDTTCQRGEIIGMRTGRTLVLMALLVVQPICVLGDGTVSPPNPIGEELYRPHLLRDLLPIAVIACALLVGWLIHAAHRKAKRRAPDQAESHHG